MQLAPSAQMPLRGWQVRRWCVEEGWVVVVVVVLTEDQREAVGDAVWL